MQQTIRPLVHALVRAAIAIRDIVGQVEVQIVIIMWAAAHQVDGVACHAQQSVLNQMHIAEMLETMHVTIQLVVAIQTLTALQLQAIPAMRLGW